MNEAETRAVRTVAPRLNPERVAYWYLRLNGFLQIDNFVVHPTLSGGQRTDADLIGVRFPNRAERYVDDPRNEMEDDKPNLNLSPDKIDVVIAEVKTARCALNGPWTNPDGQNIQRVLAAIGCLPKEEIDGAADALYGRAWYEARSGLRIRLLLFGSAPNRTIQARYDGITQVTWADALQFVYDRFQKFALQKARTDQWDDTGKELKSLAMTNSPKGFYEQVIARMRVQPPEAQA